MHTFNSRTWLDFLLTIFVWLVDGLLMLSGWLVGLVTLTFWPGKSAWHRLGKNENGEKTRLVSFFSVMGSVQGVQHSEISSSTGNWELRGRCDHCLQTNLACQLGMTFLPSFPALISCPHFRWLAQSGFRSSRGHWGMSAHYSVPIYLSLQHWRTLL